MTPLNLPMIRIQYEVLHDSVKDIAEQHDIPERVVRYAVQQEGWQRQETALVGTTEEQTQIEQAITDIEQRNNVAHTLRQGILDPQYIRIEAALTGKTLQAINALNVEEPSTSTRLKQLTEILATLRPTKAMIDNKNPGGDTGVKIVIMNRFGDASQSPSSTEEVEVVVGSPEGRPKGE